MAWRATAPAIFRKASPFVPQQGRFFETAAPIGSREYELFDDYVNGGESLWFNNYLRGINLENISERDRNEYKKKTSTINKRIRAAPRSRQNIVLFRAIAQHAPQLQHYKKGDDADFLNKGIISTSISYTAAASFLEADETCCMLVILIPSGSRFLEVLERSGWDEEAEILLPHGSQFKVLRSSTVETITTYYCIIITQISRNYKF